MTNITTPTKLIPAQIAAMQVELIGYRCEVAVGITAAREKIIRKRTAIIAAAMKKAGLL